MRDVAETIKRNIRTVDFVARLGGDEFAILLPETGYDSAWAAIEKVQSSLLKVVGESGWSITFSIGIVTCLQARSTRSSE